MVKNVSVSYKFNILTPFKSWPDRNVVSVNVAAANGRLTVLARHQPMVCAVKAGLTRIENADGSSESWTTGAGTLEVTRNEVTLLVRNATPPP